MDRTTRKLTLYQNKGSVFDITGTGSFLYRTWYSNRSELTLVCLALVYDISYLIHFFIWNTGADPGEFSPPFF